MQNVEKQPHIHLSKKHMQPVVLVVGDPGRALKVAGMCDSHTELMFNREYRSFECVKNGEKFLVISHGIGCAGAAICFEELIECGAKVIFRAGTCGTLQPQRIKQGDVVVCHSAVVDEGFSERYVPAGYPAVADFDILKTLMETADEHGTGAKMGMTCSQDVFYPSPVAPSLSKLETLQKANVEVVEMEASALFNIARIRGIKAGALVAIDGCPLAWDAGDYDPAGNTVENGKKNMLEIAINAAAKLSKQYK